MNVRNDFEEFGESSNRYRFRYRNRMNDSAAIRRIHANKEQEHKDFLEKVNCIMRAADVGLIEIDTKENEEKIGSEILRTRVEVLSKHKITKGKEEFSEYFDFNVFESEGTKNLLYIVPYIVEALDDGGVIIYDELDSSLHPLLTQMIVKLFNNNKTNVRSQLIFSAHDISLIDNKMDLFRRDQIYFCEKVKGISDIYSLFDIKINEVSIRPDENFTKNYISGKYKAVPLIKEIDFTYCNTLAKGKIVNGK